MASGCEHQFDDFQHFRDCLREALERHALQGLADDGSFVFNFEAVVQGMATASDALRDCIPRAIDPDPDLLAMVHQVLRCIAGVAQEIHEENEQ